MEGYEEEKERETEEERRGERREENEERREELGVRKEGEEGGSKVVEVETDWAMLRQSRGDSKDVTRRARSQVEERSERSRSS